MKILSQLVDKQGISKVDDKGIQFYLKFLWAAAGVTIFVSPVAAIYHDEISQNIVLWILILLTMIPVGIAYLTLFIDIFNTYKMKLLILLPLVFFPVVMIVVVSVAPFAHLVVITLRYRAYRRSLVEL